MLSLQAYPYIHTYTSTRDISKYMFKIKTHYKYIKNYNNINICKL